MRNCVYVVLVDADYCNWEVFGIFSTREKAENFIKKENFTENTKIECWEIE